MITGFIITRYLTFTDTSPLSKIIILSLLSTPPEPPIKNEETWLMCFLSASGKCCVSAVCQFDNQLSNYQNCGLEQFIWSIYSLLQASPVSCLNGATSVLIIKEQL